MNDLNTHYRQLVGVSDDWNVVDIDLGLDANRVIIDLRHAGGKHVPNAKIVHDKLQIAKNHKVRRTE